MWSERISLGEHPRAPGSAVAGQSHRIEATCCETHCLPPSRPTPYLQPPHRCDDLSSLARLGEFHFEPVSCVLSTCSTRLAGLPPTFRRCLPRAALRSGRLRRRRSSPSVHSVISDGTKRVWLAATTGTVCARPRHHQSTPCIDKDWHPIPSSSFTRPSGQAARPQAAALPALHLAVCTRGNPRLGAHPGVNKKAQLQEATPGWGSMYVDSLLASRQLGSRADTLLAARAKPTRLLGTNLLRTRPAVLACHRGLR